MKQATFYTHIEEPIRFACRLAQTVYQRGERLLLWTDQHERAAEVDAKLWSFQASSFVPHELWLPDTALPDDVPVLIGCDDRLPEISLPVVLNLSQAYWHQVSGVGRVLELIGAGADELAAARSRFKAYRAAGFAIEHHNMSGKG